MAKKISGCLITYNEEVLLPRALDNMKQFCEEIIIVDSFSTDKTLEVATKYKCSVYNSEFVNHRDQKNLAISKCNNEWIFLLDADEYANDNLTKVMMSGNLVGQLDMYKIDAIGFPRYNLLDGEGPRGWPDVQTRLFKHYVRHGGHPHHHSTTVNALNPSIVPLDSGLYIIHDKDMTRQKRQNRLYYYSRPMDYTTPPEGAEDMVIPPERYSGSEINLYKEFLLKEQDNASK